MKKSFLLGIALLAAMSSCTNDVVMDEKGANSDINPNAPVAIQLGVAGTISAGVENSPSRAVVNEWSNTRIAIFGLAKSGNWNSVQDAGNPTVLWNNVEGVVGHDNVVSNFVLNNQPGYYPNQGTLNYSFYGYCLSDDIRTIEEWPTPSINEEGNIVTTSFTIDGTNDVLWGKAEAPTLNGKGEDSGTQYQGYNAKYFRKADGATTPNLAFGHLLTQLQFNVKKSAMFDSTQTLYLKRITIKNVETNLDLTIADISGSNTSGKLVVNPEDGNIQDLSVNNIPADGIDITALVGENPIKAGDAIMLYTDGVNTKSFEIEVELAGGALETSPTSVNTLTITAPLNAAYEAGKAYKVNLTINSLIGIELNATLTPWEESEYSIEGSI